MRISYELRLFAEKYKNLKNWSIYDVMDFTVNLNQIPGKMEE